MANGWTPERRQRQAALIRQWKPWEQSTGPRTEQGKAISAQRGFMGGTREVLRQLRQLMREQDQIRRNLIE